jgi:hypothetical protein
MFTPHFCSLKDLYTQQEWGTPSDHTLQNAFAEQLGTGFYFHASTPSASVQEVTLRADSALTTDASHSHIHAYQHFDKIYGAMRPVRDAKGNATFGPIANDGTDTVLDYGNVYYYTATSLKTEIKHLQALKHPTPEQTATLNRLNGILTQPLYTVDDAKAGTLYASWDCVP